MDCKNCETRKRMLEIMEDSTQKIKDMDNMLHELRRREARYQKEIDRLQASCQQKLNFSDN